jgi:hypothetical protein
MFQLKFLYTSLVKAAGDLYKAFEPFLVMLAEIGLDLLNDGMELMIRNIRFFGDMVPVFTQGVLAITNTLALAMKTVQLIMSENKFGRAALSMLGMETDSGVLTAQATNLKALVMNSLIAIVHGTKFATGRYDDPLGRFMEDQGEDADGEVTPTNVQNFTGPVNIIVKTETVDDPQLAARVLEQGFTETARRGLSARRRIPRSNIGGF